jgi:hypothetical protein
MVIGVSNTLHLDVFAAECHPLWLVCLDTLRADVDLLPQHPPLLDHEHFFHNGENRRAMLLPHGHGAIHDPLDWHTRDLNLLAPERLIDMHLPLMDDLGKADLARLNHARVDLRSSASTGTTT